MSQNGSYRGLTKDSYYDDQNGSRAEGEEVRAGGYTWTPTTTTTTSRSLADVESQRRESLTLENLRPTTYAVATATAEPAESLPPWDAMDIFRTTRRFETRTGSSSSSRNYGSQKFNNYSAASISPRRTTDFAGSYVFSRGNNTSSSLYPSLDCLDQETEPNDGTHEAESWTTTPISSYTAAAAVPVVRQPWEVVTKEDTRKVSAIPATTATVAAATTATIEVEVEAEPAVAVAIATATTTTTTAIYEEEDGGDLDCKPPARSPGQSQDELVVTHGDAIAAVIDYDVHPSELLIEATPALLLGHEHQASGHVMPESYATSYATSYAVPATSAAYTTTYHQTYEESLPSEQVVGVAVVESDPNNYAVSATATPYAAATSTAYETSHASVAVVESDPNSYAVSATATPYAATTSTAYQTSHASVAVAESDPNSYAVSATATPYAAATTTTTYQTNHSSASVGSGQVMEVAVIESGPMEKATVEAWSASTSGQAQVLMEEDAAFIPESTFVTKPHPTSTSDDRWPMETHDHGRTTSAHYNMYEGEAEVIEVSDDVHPSAYIEDISAEAELVGPDFNIAIGVPSGSHHHFDANHSRHDSIAEADIIVEESDYQQQQHEGNTSQFLLPHEAHATIVEHESNQPDYDINGGVAIAVHEPSPFRASISSTRSRSEPVPATPVTVLEEMVAVPEMPARVSFRDVVKSEPYSGPVARAQLEEQPIQGESLPSFGGESSLRPPIPPPTSQSTNATLSTPRRESSNSESGSGSKSRNRSVATSTPDTPLPGLQMLSSGFARGANNVMETLFGNTPSVKGPYSLSGADFATVSGSVVPRTLLPWSVIYSESTKSWVATVNTNQKALEANNVQESSKSLRAFSVPTQQQAVSLAKAWAPPQMHPFASNATCIICDAPFTVFRRACHCRNCGVCICGNCSIQWPAKMLPVTYNIKNETTVTICKACDWLCSEFRLSLLDGDHDKAMALYSTRNINLTTPFANVKGELFYPVHCAVLGGNLDVLKWLVDEHCCPLRSIRVSNGKVCGSVGGSYTPILTSKGRSLLGIAMGSRNIGIVRYLVVEKRMLLSAEKSLSIETLTANLDLVLRILPESAVMEQGLDSSTRGSITAPSRQDSIDISEIPSIIAPGPEEDSVSATDSDVCIICYDATISCVFTPCGHQICCITCGNNISRCPVCAVECSAIRVFKP